MDKIRIPRYQDTKILLLSLNTIAAFGIDFQNSINTIIFDGDDSVGCDGIPANGITKRGLRFIDIDEAIKSVILKRMDGYGC